MTPRAVAVFALVGIGCAADRGSHRSAPPALDAARGWIAGSISRAPADCDVVLPPSEPLPGALILGVNVATGQVTSTVAGDEGHYRLEVPAGTYRVLFRHTTQQVRREPVRVMAGETLPLFTTFERPDGKCAHAATASGART